MFHVKTEHNEISFFVHDDLSVPHRIENQYMGKIEMAASF